MMHRTKIVKRGRAAERAAWKKPHEAALAAASLQSATLWADTTEGHDYWREVYGRLCQAAGVAPFSDTVC